MFRNMRRVKQELSEERIKELLKSEKRAALSVNGDDGYPYSVPVNFYFDETENKIYIHSSPEGHKVDGITKNDKVCFNLWTDGYKEPGDWYYHVDSVVLFGRASFVTDETTRDEKLYKFGAKYFPESVDLNKEVNDGRNLIKLICIDIEHVCGKHVKEK